MNEDYFKIWTLIKASVYECDQLHFISIFNVQCFNNRHHAWITIGQSEYKVVQNGNWLSNNFNLWMILLDQSIIKTLKYLLSFFVRDWINIVETQSF